MDLKHYEVAPVFSKTQHVMIPDLVIAESAYLERMKPEDRELLTQILEDSVEDEFNLWNEQIETAKESARNMESPLRMWISNRSRKTAKAS